MTLPIIEQPLFGQIQLETAAWSTPFTWVDRTADVVSGINYSEGGRLGTPGSSVVDPGNLNATFKNLVSIPTVGGLVRLRRFGTTEYFFTGYIVDVSQRVVFDESVSFTTPVVLTSIQCSDWVGYLAQFQAVGAGGFTAAGVNISTSNYSLTSRVRALNRVIDPSGATTLISGSFGNIDLGDTDFVGTLSEHLDLLTATDSSVFWSGQHKLPTNKTTGRTGLVEVSDSPITKSDTFTDAVGSVGDLHYTEIDFENSSKNVANEIVINNRSRLHVALPEVTKVGGFNLENYVVVNNTQVAGIPIDTTENASSSTSISTYGVRQAVFETNASVSSGTTYNLFVNPSAEYSDDGFSGGAGFRVRRRKPSEDVNPFAAFDGQWAMRCQVVSALSQVSINFSGGESDGIPVVGGVTYYFFSRAARGTVSRTDIRSSQQINWFDVEENLISVSATGTTNLTNANTWYLNGQGATAPANAVRATVGVNFTRPSGTIPRFDRLWADGFSFSRDNTNYYHGDTPSSSIHIRGWTGGVGSSPSFQTANVVDEIATNALSLYSTTDMRATRIRWNAQENLEKVHNLYVNMTISVVYKGTETEYRIIGIDGNIDPERYMIDYYLQKV